MKALPVLSFVVGALAFCSSAEAKLLQHGVASCYGPGFHGRRTANGEKFNNHALTAAHKTLPFGSRVRVTNERTGRSVVVRINDRARQSLRDAVVRFNAEGSQAWWTAPAGAGPSG